MVVKVRTLLLLLTVVAALANATTLLALDVPALTKGSSVVDRKSVV